MNSTAAAVGWFGRWKLCVPFREKINRISKEVKLVNKRTISTFCKGKQILQWFQFSVCM